MLDSYNPDSNDMRNGNDIHTTDDIHMKYVNLDKNIRKQEKSNLKRSIRRRVEKSRNNRSSDMESDTGSDGLAVNSEGSGRSGDWGPPKIRRKSKSYRKRQENRMSLTDSGISLSKTDLESLSGLSIPRHSTPEYPHHNHRNLHPAYNRHPTKQCEDDKSLSTTEDSSLEQKNHSKPTPLPPTLGYISESNALTETDNTNNNDNDDRTRPISRVIEEKENAILQQCIKNEKLINEDGSPVSYAVDCSDPLPQSRQSRFPLPDHLNYPICRYRLKTETNNRVHPLQKLKNGWKKLRSKKLFNDKPNTSADTDCYPEFYPNFVTSDHEEDSEAILSRLSRNPNQRRNFAKRVFGRFGSKTYSTNTNDCLEDKNRISRMSRSGSTRSVPDALQEMWTKVHYNEGGIPTPNEPTNHKVLHKVKSMPSIHTNSNTTSNMFERENYFNQIDTHAHTNHSQQTNAYNSDENLANKNELVDRLTGLHITTTQDSNCVDKNTDRKVCFDENGAQYYDEFRNQPDPLDDDKMSLARSSKKYSSCHELYQRASQSQTNTNTNGDYLAAPTTQMYYQPQVCTGVCCMPQNGQQMQLVPFYPYPNYVYQMPNGYHQMPNGYPPLEYMPNYYPINGVQGYYPPNTDQSNQMVTAQIVAPLDVKVEHDKKAEKRKISEMVFDTFV